MKKLILALVVTIIIPLSSVQPASAARAKDVGGGYPRINFYTGKKFNGDLLTIKNFKTDYCYNLKGDWYHWNDNIRTVENNTSYKLWVFVKNGCNTFYWNERFYPQNKYAWSDLNTSEAFALRYASSFKLIEYKK